MKYTSTELVKFGVDVLSIEALPVCSFILLFALANATTNKTRRVVLYLVDIACLIWGIIVILKWLDEKGFLALWK